MRELTMLIVALAQKGNIEILMGGELSGRDGV
mgnify:CR=1 FL=1